MPYSERLFADFYVPVTFMIVKEIEKKYKNMKRMYTLFSLTVLLLYTTCTFAQKGVTVTYENIKQQCEDVPLDQRLRITVSRFNVTTPHTGGEFGNNMATMLSNALQEINCFRVLGSLKDNYDLEEEIDFGESKYANKKGAPKKGKMLGAQAIITGEVTGYNLNNSSQGYGPVRIASQTLNLSFIIQIRNPETREILFSKKFNVTGKKGGGVGVRYGWYSYGGAGVSNDAEADALDKGLVQAVEFIAAQKDKLTKEITGSTSTATQNKYNITYVIISNANYNIMSEFDNILKKIAEVKNTDPSLDEDIAGFTVQHTGSSAQLVEKIKLKAGQRYVITGLKDGAIKIAAR